MIAHLHHEFLETRAGDQPLPRSDDLHDGVMFLTEYEGVPCFPDVPEDSSSNCTWMQTSGSGDPGTPRGAR